MIIITIGLVMIIIPVVWNYLNCIRNLHQINTDTIDLNHAKQINTIIKNKLSQLHRLSIIDINRITPDDNTKTEINRILNDWTEHEKNTGIGYEEYELERHVNSIEMIGTDFLSYLELYGEYANLIKKNKKDEASELFSKKLEPILKVSLTGFIGSIYDFERNKINSSFDKIRSNSGIILFNAQQISNQITISSKIFKYFSILINLNSNIERQSLRAMQYLYLKDETNLNLYNILQSRSQGYIKDALYLAERLNNSPDIASQDDIELLMQLGNNLTEYNGLIQKCFKLSEAGKTKELIKILDNDSPILEKNIYTISTILITDAQKKSDFENIKLKEILFNSGLIYIIILTLFALFVLLILNFILRSMIISLDDITNAIKLITNDNLDHKITVRSTDEFALLAAAFNKMIVDLKLSKQKLIESEQNLRNIYEMSNDGITVIDKEKLTFLMVNDGFCKILGYSKEELEGKPVYIIYREETREEDKKRFKRHIDRKEIHSSFIPFQKKDGTIIYVDTSSSNVIIGGKDFLLGIIRDVTERKEKMDQIEQFKDKAHEDFKIQQLLNVILKISMESINLKKQLEIILLLIHSAEWLGLNSHALIHLVDETNEDKLVLFAHVGMSEELQKEWANINIDHCVIGDAVKNMNIIYSDIKYVGQCGNEPFQDRYISPILSGEKLLGVLNVYLGKDFDRETKTNTGNNLGQKLESFLSSLLTVLASIIEKKKIEQSLKQMANHDLLTNLPNRTFFKSMLSQTLWQASRYNESFAILFIDLDGFKAVNDNFGHNIGDLLLKEVASRLSSCLRRIDVLSRIGGDEFIVMLSRINSRDDVSEVAKKIIQQISHPFLLDSNTCKIGTSVGISIYPDDGDNEEELIKKADNSMYEVKKRGKNNFKFYC
ncbi:MAG: diguanylate cyclase [Nitrospirae bacterium]|nr:diguanylate cyclase [Nitrospirota bacterium]